MPLDPSKITPAYRRLKARCGARSKIHVSQEDLDARGRLMSAAKLAKRLRAAAQPSDSQP